MTASEVAQRFRAKREGRGKWRAVCPIHGGKHSGPLIISERKDGSTGVHCFGQCDTKAVLSAVGLTFHDLFPESRRPTEWEMKRLEAQRKTDERREAAEKAKKRRLIEQANYWRAEVQRLGKLLAEQPDSDKLARQFHWAVDRQRTAQEAIRPYFHKAFIGDADL